MPRLGVPAETVRDWRLRFRSRAEAVAAHLLRWARVLDGAALLTVMSQGSPVGDALEAIGVCVRVVSLVGIAQIWPSANTSGRLC